MLGSWGLDISKGRFLGLRSSLEWCVTVVVASVPVDGGSWVELVRAVLRDSVAAGRSEGRSPMLGRLGRSSAEG
eukprot:986026-Amphidinium_carterae.1